MKWTSQESNHIIIAVRKILLNLFISQQLKPYTRGLCGLSPSPVNKFQRGFRPHRKRKKKTEAPPPRQIPVYASDDNSYIITSWELEYF